MLTRRALKLCPIDVRLSVARDGEEALKMLADSAFRPQLIILDLNMPRVSGCAVLERYANEKVPVVIFSSSWNEADVRATRRLGAREYVRKPITLQAFTNAILGIVSRWLIQIPELVAC